MQIWFGLLCSIFLREFEFELKASSDINTNDHEFELDYLYSTRAHLTFEQEPPKLAQANINLCHVSKCLTSTEWRGIIGYSSSSISFFLSFQASEKIGFTTFDKCLATYLGQLDNSCRCSQAMNLFKSNTLVWGNKRVGSYMYIHIHTFFDNSGVRTSLREPRLIFEDQFHHPITGVPITYTNTSTRRSHPYTFLVHFTPVSTFEGFFLYFEIHMSQICLLMDSLWTFPICKDFLINSS